MIETATLDPRACSRTTLAAGDFMVVEQCSCGAVHVTIGAVTMRLARAALPSLAATLGEAARALVLRDAFAPTSSLRVLS